MTPTRSPESVHERFRRRCLSSGLIFLGGLAFAFLSLQVDHSIGSPAILGIYAMAAALLRFGASTIRYSYNVAVLRKNARKPNWASVVYSGGIR